MTPEQLAGVTPEQLARLQSVLDDLAADAADYPLRRNFSIHRRLDMLEIEVHGLQSREGQKPPFPDQTVDLGYVVNELRIAQAEIKTLRNEIEGIRLTLPPKDDPGAQ